MLTTLLAQLNKPYPTVQESRLKWRMLLIISLFISLFLFIFRPYGLESLELHETYHFLGFGSVTAIVMWLFYFGLPWLQPGFYDEDQWTIGKEFGATLSIILFIAAGNWMYTLATGLSEVSIINLGYSLVITAAVGIFPVAGIIAWTYIRTLKQTLSEAEKLDRQLLEYSHQPAGLSEGQLIISDEEGKEKIILDQEQLLYIAAAENYVEVFYLENKQLRKKLLRNTLQQVEEMLRPFHNMFRCHRSYLINFKKLVHIQGSAQGYRIQLQEVPILLPVARSRTQTFKQLIQG